MGQGDPAWTVTPGHSPGKSKPFACRFGAPSLVEGHEQTLCRRRTAACDGRRRERDPLARRAVHSGRCPSPDPGGGAFAIPALRRPASRRSLVAHPWSLRRQCAASSCIAWAGWTARARSRRGCGSSLVAVRRGDEGRKYRGCDRVGRETRIETGLGDHSEAVYQTSLVSVLPDPAFPGRFRGGRGCTRAEGLCTPRRCTPGPRKTWVPRAPKRRGFEHASEWSRPLRR